MSETDTDVDIDVEAEGIVAAAQAAVDEIRAQAQEAEQAPEPAAEAAANVPPVVLVHERVTRKTLQRDLRLAGWEGPVSYPRARLVEMLKLVLAGEPVVLARIGRPPFPRPAEQEQPEPEQPELQ